MPKLSKPVVDTDLRDTIFNDIILQDTVKLDYKKVNDRQYGVILTDKNGVERYCRVGVIVAEEREDMTARQLMQIEIDKYNASQEKKKEKKDGKKDS